MSRVLLKSLILQFSSVTMVFSCESIHCDCLNGDTSTFADLLILTSQFRAIFKKMSYYLYINLYSHIQIVIGIIYISPTLNFLFHLRIKHNIYATPRLISPLAWQPMSVFCITFGFKETSYGVHVGMYKIHDGTTQESPFESSRSEDDEEGSKVAARAYAHLPRW